MARKNKRRKKPPFCERKRKHHNKISAQMEAYRMSKLHPKSSFQSYYCEWCHCYHV